MTTDVPPSNYFVSLPLLAPEIPYSSQYTYNTFLAVGDAGPAFINHSMGCWLKHSLTEGSHAREVATDSSHLMVWGPDKQTMSYGNQTFTHEGAIDTDPSHDLAHLIVAACGPVQWAPEGHGASIKLAEFNAIFLEHLLNNAYNAAGKKTRSAHQVYEKTKEHGKWFVEIHFAPFPISYADAERHFIQRVNMDILADLCIVFFLLKIAERSDPLYKSHTWIINLDDFRPGKPRDRLCRRFQQLVVGALKLSVSDIQSEA